jgi:3-dehydroquinate synthetase
VKQEINLFLEKYNLPTFTTLSKDELFKFVCLDKKRSNEYLSIIYVDKIGECEIRKVNIEEIKEYL